jgi:hypothetical protein
MTVLFPFAQASEMAPLELSLQAISQSVKLTDKKYEPIYESQPYETTCDRQVFDHTETTCSTTSVEHCSGGGTVCEDEPDQVCNSQGCTSITRRSCHKESESCSSTPSISCTDQSIYRTEYYSCTQYHDVVVGHRLVKTFYHDVEVVMENPELLKNQNLKINVIANESSVYLKLSNSFTSHLLVVEPSKISDSNNSTEQKLSQRLVIKAAYSMGVLNHLLSTKIEHLELNYSGIRFDMNSISELSKDLNFRVSLVQQRKILKDLVLFEGNIDSSILSLAGAGQDLKVMIPLEKMKLMNLKSKKYNLNVSVSFKKPSLSILNDADLSEVLKCQIKGELQMVYPN